MPPHLLHFYAHQDALIANRKFLKVRLPRFRNWELSDTLKVSCVPNIFVSRLPHFRWYCCSQNRYFLWQQLLCVIILWFAWSLLAVMKCSEGKFSTWTFSSAARRFRMKILLVLHLILSWPGQGSRSVLRAGYSLLSRLQISSWSQGRFHPPNSQASCLMWICKDVLSWLLLEFQAF